MYHDAARFSSLLKFDLQVTLSIVLLVLRNGAHLKALEIIVLAVGVPFAVMWAVLGWMSVRRFLGFFGRSAKLLSATYALC